MCVTCGCSTTDKFHTPHPRHDRASRLIEIEQAVLATNDEIARANRALLATRGITTINLLSSPGSGKTTLLVKTIEALAARYRISVIEGDQQTDHDAARVRATGAPAVQINTGKGCHLDAHMVARGLAGLPVENRSLLFIENVGNLVCPAEFDLGEDFKVVILSVTEGEDKPLKYPNMFHAADVVVLNKVDLLPHLDFDMDQCVAHIARIKPGAPVFTLSATRGDGMSDWLRWIETHHATKTDAQARKAAANRNASDRV